MSDSRPTIVLFGALTVIAALFAPWGVLDVNDEVRAQLAQQAGNYPAAIGDFARGAIAMLPAHISFSGWEGIDKGDWIMSVCAALGLLAAFSGRMGFARLASSAAILTILWVMVGPRGEFGANISLAWGAYLGLGGAAIMVVGACMQAPKPAQRREELVGWSSASVRSYPSDGYPAGYAPVVRDTSRSVPPPG